MAPKSPAAAAITNAPSPQARLNLAVGGTLALAGAAAGAAGVWELGVGLLGTGALVLGLGLYTRRLGAAVHSLNRSLDAIARGRLGEAEALLEHAEATTRVGYLRRVVDLQRSLIALRRGEVPAAMQRADAAVERPLAWFGRGQERVNTISARSLRALLRASSGEEQGAREDLTAVRGSADAIPEALARAELAEAILLERSGDREALRAHLEGARTLLLEYGAPRERAVVRAYQRLLQARRSSVYREGAAREAPREAGDEPTVADWMTAVVPAAAPFAAARRATPGDEGGAARPPSEPAEVIDPTARRAAQTRLKGKSGWAWTGRLGLLWVLLIGMFLAIWQFLAPPEPYSRTVEVEDPTGPMSSAPALVLVFALTFAVLMLMRRHAHKQGQRLLAALATIARGGEARGEAELRSLIRSRYPLVAGRAWLELAMLEDRRAAFPEVLDACDRAVAALSRNPSVRAVASATLLPEIFAERAFALAALDRDAEAAAEMALVGETYPGHPFHARAELRVRLLRRVRRGDLEGAAALVAQGTDDIPLNLRDEALADMVRATVHPGSVGAGEIERLKQELRLDRGLRPWLAAAAPAALEAFETRGEAPTPDDGAAEEEAAAIHEEEARAARARAAES